MLNNGNFLGSYDLSKQNWNSGVYDMRSHAAMKYSGRFPEYPVLPDDVSVSNTNIIGPFTGKSVSTLAQDTAPNAVFLSDDGTMMFINGTTADSVYRYNLSTAYDVSTATLHSSYAFGATVVDPTGLSFSPDGTKMLVLGLSADTIYSYTLSTPWAVATAVYDSKSFSVTTQEATPAGFYVKPDGTKFWVTGGTSDTLYEYSMSTPWDLATAVYNAVSLSVTSYDTSPGNICWNSTGSQFYLLGRTGSAIFVWNAPNAWSTTGSTYAGRFNFGAIVSALTNAVSPGYTVGAARSAYFIPGTNKVYVIDSTSDRVFQFDNPTVDNLSVTLNCGYLVQDQSFTGTSTVRGFCFKPDGSRFWVGNSTGLVREYLCSSNWTVTSATLVATHVRQPIDSATTLTGAGFIDIAFSADGLWFYQNTSGTNKYFSQWALLSPWDLSSALYMKYASATILGTNAASFAFSKDGRYVYYTPTASSQSISRKELANPWDISTAGTATTISLSAVIGSGYTSGLTVSEDGKYLYTTTNAVTTRILKFEMTTTFDVTTLVLRSSAYAEGTAPSPVNISLDRTGQRIFLADSTNSTIVRYTTA
jgi:sugar lactone lactonase YvrE